ncbi:MAG: hypothetical protein ABIP55_11760, partial [Tepidisphaeraceae bacterium]
VIIRTTMRAWLSSIALTLLLGQASGFAFAAEPPPATTRAAADVEVAIVKIEPGPTRVSGKINNVSAADLFFKLAQQANVGIVAHDGSWDDPTLAGATFSAEWENQPLWDVINEACETTGLRPSIDASGSGLPRINLQRGPAKTPVAVDGPVLIRPQRLGRTASISYADGKRQEDQVKLSLTVLLEPKLLKYAIVGPATIDKAEDENGKAIPPIARPPEDPRNMRFGEPSIALFTYPPKMGPAKAGRKFAVVRGSVPLQIAKEIAIVTFNDPFANPREMTAKIGPHTLILKKPTGDAKRGYNVNLRLERGDVAKAAPDDNRPDPAADLHWAMASRPIGRFGASIVMIGPKSETSQNGGSAGWDNKEAHTELHFSSRQPGDEPTALRVELPVSFSPAQAKFEFKDLPLP